MILVLEEDNVLRLYDSLGTVVREIEALDIEESTRAIFDEAGQTYVIEWIRPNKSGRAPGFLRFLGWAENGEYRLVPSGERNPAALLDAIRQSVAVEPESFEQLVRTLEQKLEGPP